jgi:hypothetical protein
MQYNRHKFGDFSASATGLHLASLPAMFDKYPNTLEQAGTGRTLTLDPAPSGTFYIAAAEERRGFRGSDANHDECGLEVDLASKHGQVRLHLQRIRNQSLSLLSKS